MGSNGFVDFSVDGVNEGGSVVIMVGGESGVMKEKVLDGGEGLMVLDVICFWYWNVIVVLCVIVIVILK